jgi:hypothetical protein
VSTAAASASRVGNRTPATKSSTATIAGTGKD